ncbi:MAG TPA: tRNA dihydrouridine(20/20a) synthase DusA [Steroidobacteraceae bacterium]|nr:tRNA dihydrouridine(20/20a) synthase DusA [Steroidobacteraceae bacterium]
MGAEVVTNENRSESIDRRISVAPMMEWTDRHCRYFLRQFSPHTRLYTEMIHAAAIVRGDATRLLRFSAEEQPLAIQLGGSDPVQLAAAARRAEDAGFIEVNLNCGCPSDRVRSGAFGACLMQQPQLVAECVAAMKQAVRLPVTVKFRIGVVDRDAVGSSAAALARGQIFDADDTRMLEQFARALMAAGTDMLIVHARKAVLGGLSPHENRTVPPLRYDAVASLRAALRPDAGTTAVPVIANGGLRTRPEVLQALAEFDGVMIGREAYHRPELLGELHAALHPDDPPPPGPLEVLQAMCEYARRESAAGTPLNAITRHMLGLLSGRPGARALRQILSGQVQQGVPAAEIFSRAMALAGAAHDEPACSPQLPSAMT